MSSKQFLEDMLGASEQWSGSGGTGIISRIKIEFGLHRYVAGHDFWSFWKPAANAADLERVGEELTGRLRQAGCSDTPTRGIKVTIDKNVLGREQPYKADLQEFIPEWQRDAFELLSNHIVEGGFDFNEWAYGKIEYKANPYFVKQGEAGKKETDQNGNPRFPSIRVPVEKYANEQAARAAASDSGSSATTTAADNSEWSDTARSNLFPNGINKGEQEEIYKFYLQVLNGTPWPGRKLPYEPSAPDALKQMLTKKEISEQFQIETADVDQVLLNQAF